MHEENQQMLLAQTLLRYIAWNAQNPESFKLFCGGFLCDMASRTKARPVLDSGWNIGFRFVLCQDNMVLAAALPYAVREDGKETPLHQWEEEALRAAGIPLFADLLVEKTAENGEPVLRMKSFTCPEPSDWRFPTVDVPQEVWDFLVKKGLALRDKYAGFSATKEGERLGLYTTHWRRSRLGRRKSLSCSTVGWLYRLWVPKETPPLWTVLPLDTRLKRMLAGRAGNPGHIISAFQELDAMPLEPLLLEHLDDVSLEKNMALLQEIYKPGITYGQAARDADRWMRSERRETREIGCYSFENLTIIVGCKSILRNTETDLTPQKRITAIHKTKPADRTLSTRLAGANIFKTASRRFPLVNDNMKDIFQGLHTLLGTDALAQKFYQNVLPQLIPDWSDSESQMSQWDGSFGGMIHYIWEQYMCDQSESDIPYAPSCLDFRDQALWHLLIEPYCLLDSAWKLEEERGRLLEGLQAWNESLKQELEGMKFDGNIH